MKCRNVNHIGGTEKMGNYESIIKVEEIRRLLSEERYEKAEQVLDTLDVAKIKQASDLSLFAEVYCKNNRFDEAYQLLVRIYEKNHTRRVLYQLVEICIQRKDIENAKEYLKEYESVEPEDFYRYVFLYKIQKMSGESIENQIETLEYLKQTEYIEQWAYELAKLYHKAGNKEKCVKECKDICLWFGEGIYVEKAKLLKLYYEDDANQPNIIEELKSKAKKSKEK